MPPLTATDIVYACGSPRMVEALAEGVNKAGATFYADPFEAAGPDEPSGLFGRLKTLVQPRRSPPPSGEETSPSLVPGRRTPPGREERAPAPWQVDPFGESLDEPDNAPPVRRRAASGRGNVVSLANG